MNPDFPRLLVATEFSPNASGGGPAVVRQMLKDWPAENLFWWSCFAEHSARFGQRFAVHRPAAIPLRLYPNQRACRQKSWLMEQVWIPWASRHFRNTLAELQPDVVWVIPHMWAIPPIFHGLRRAKVGFHTTMQDYMDTRTWIERLGSRRVQGFASMADWLYANATTRDATGHPMIADLRARTGREAAQMLHAGLELEDFDYLTTKNPSCADKIRIVYAGSVSVEPSFELFARALGAIRDQLPRLVSIEVFSSHSYRTRKWFDPSWMNERGNLPEPDFTRAQRECTWGFAPMSLSEDEPRHRFSFPTKFISYLAAGLPIFTLGHPETSVVKMAQTYNVGACVTSGDLGNLSKKLLEVLSIPEPWRIFGPEILRCARGEYDAVDKRRTLYRCFSDCARRSSKPA